MSNSELTKAEHLDGFDGFSDRIEGDEGTQRGSIIQGITVKFSNEAEWLDRDEEEFPSDREVVVTDVLRIVQKWKDQQPVETIILQPKQKFPDIERLNAEVPQSEWREGPDGKKHGPWQAQYIVYLLDPATMNKYTYPTGTTGGAIAVRDLVDKVRWMRRLRGPGIHPVVTLSDTFMNTKFGGRQRPHFLIKRWINLGGGEGATAVTAPSVNSQLQPPDVHPAARLVPSDKTFADKTVEEPTLKEQMNDSIPF